jgi:tyrosine-protein phosphatase
VLSITEENRSDDQDQLNGEQESVILMKPPPVPNFSRQLPFRTSTAFESTDDSYAPSKSSEVFLMAPSQPSGLGLDAMHSPMAASFNIPPLAPVERSMEADMAHPRSKFPPPRMEFNVSSWSRNDEPESYSPHPGNNSSSYNPFSQRAATFDVSPGYKHPAEYDDSPAHDFEVTSPIRTEFPKDPFARAFPKDPFAPTSNGFDRELKAQRSTEFHMAPLKPDVDVANEDPFGLTSPTRFEFPGNPLGLELAPPPEDEDRRPSFQAILPPSHEAFNGFASLNGTADEAFPIPIPNAHVKKDAYDGNARIDDVKVSEPQPRPTLEPNGHPLAKSDPIAIQPPPIPETFLSSPERPTGIRTRFSSPNMREQRKLHKLQTEMEAMLPSRSPKIPQGSQDDLDVLLSPRAEEFVRNPFHFDLQSPTDETSPASSVETVKDTRKEWKESAPVHLTPQKVEDPRSPVHAGSSPIVRNIWDVL